MVQSVTSNEFREFMDRKSWTKYAGEWIAICNNKVVANNTNLKKVIKESKKTCKDHKPTFTKIPDKNVAMVL